MKQKRVRLDLLLTRRGIAEDVESARRMILSGEVRISGLGILKGGDMVSEDVELVVAEGRQYVSRGGVKLAGALNQFSSLAVAGRVCLDIGSSTGGFTDCLLQRGALRVHAVDVGYGLLAWKLRCDSRVVVHERSNFRKLGAGYFGEFIALAVADVSFISLVPILSSLRCHMVEGGDCVMMVKPQFEAERDEVGEGGVVRDNAVRLKVIRDIIEESERLGYRYIEGVDSQLSGPKGNVEHFLWLKF